MVHGNSENEKDTYSEGIQKLLKEQEHSHLCWLFLSKLIYLRGNIIRAYRNNWKLTILCYHGFRVNYPYPFGGAIYGNLVGFYFTKLQ